MSEALWTPVAEEDLDDILYQIAIVDGRPETADKIFFEIRDFAAQYSEGTKPHLSHPSAPSNWS